MTIVGMSSYHTKITERDNAVRNIFGCSKKEMIRRIVMDFTSGMITDCYVVFCDRAVRVNARYQTRIEIERKIETPRP